MFHAVELVTGPGEDVVGRLRPGMRLVADGEDEWVVRAGDDEVVRYQDRHIRFPVSWKAYCFADDAERDAWRVHGDDLSLDTILQTLETDLCDFPPRHRG